MRPILKWTGGKSSEIEDISRYEPKNIKRFVEPFLGGGALFFNKEMNSIVNDFNKELISFYNLIKNDEEYFLFRDIILQIQLERDSVFELDIESFDSDYLFNRFKNVSEREDYLFFLNREIISKEKSILRINKKNIEQGKEELSYEDLKTQFYTSVLAAIYYSCRNIYNKKMKNKVYDYEHIAYWFIMRELAYSGMFRYSRSGNFNVPYGGGSYNKKSLVNKISRVEAIRHMEFYKMSEFNNGDFQAFFEKYDFFEEGDFIFLDPPYDSEFSQYNVEEDFTKEDQIRLRDVLVKTKANIMVVIKETEFIRKIYEEKGFFIDTFNKSYSVNFRNRNQQNVDHLIIRNYK